MNTLLSRVSYALAQRLANQQLQQLWRLGWEAGYREGRRGGLRSMFPKASDDQLDTMLTRRRDR